jgi:pyruvate,water dikinase
VGTPISSGIVKGPVKVLRTPDEKPILPGDILVTKATDPGWTTLFINAGGVLLETGGTLQHGASVAREMGKPCIVGIEDVTKILNDVQTVELDGATGIIKILSGGTPNPA